MKKLILSVLTVFLLSVLCTIPASAEYYVEKNDSLWKIAKENHMSLKDLISLNPHLVNPAKIKVGDYIVIRTTTEKQKDLVDYARALQEKTNYVYGGQDETPPMNTDCSGWVQSIFAKFGVKLPRTAREQAVVAYGKPVKMPDLQIGDLVFFSTRADKVPTHVGIYLGTEAKAWISNLNSAKDVQILSIWGPWTQKYFVGGKRFKL
jgi:cell wall-associated NlpC family hydrolase